LRLAIGDLNTHGYYHTDGNGNVTGIVNTNGVVLARYHYDPYGNLLGMAGPLADANQYRFSSKEWHGNSGLYYYGFRYYQANLQRWFNCDPLGDIASLPLINTDLVPWTGINWNLYGAMRNNPVNLVDAFGLTDTSIHSCARNNPGEVGKIARDLLDDVAKDARRRKLANDAAKKQLKEVMDKTKELNKKLDKKHLDAAKDELKGKVVSRKPDGTPHDHVNEVKDALQGVKNQIDKLKKAQSRDVGATEKEVLQKQLDKLQTLHDRAQKALQCK
jgi:RHS repeat-associated protein